MGDSKFKIHNFSMLNINNIFNLYIFHFYFWQIPPKAKLHLDLMLEKRKGLLTCFEIKQMEFSFVVCE